MGLATYGERNCAAGVLEVFHGKDRAACDAHPRQPRLSMFVTAELQSPGYSGIAVPRMPYSSLQVVDFVQ